MPVSEIQISNIKFKFLFSHAPSIPQQRKIHYDILQDIKWKFDIFYSRDSLHNFKTLTTGYFSCRLQCKTPVDLLFLAVLVEEAFQNRKIGRFYCSQFIKILSNKQRKAKLGTVFKVFWFKMSVVFCCCPGRYHSHCLLLINNF